MKENDEIELGGERGFIWLFTPRPRAYMEHTTLAPACLSLYLALTRSQNGKGASERDHCKKSFSKLLKLVLSGAPFIAPRP